MEKRQQRAVYSEFTIRLVSAQFPKSPGPGYDARVYLEVRERDLPQAWKMCETWRVPEGDMGGRQLNYSLRAQCDKPWTHKEIVLTGHVLVGTVKGGMQDKLVIPQTLCVVTPGAAQCVTLNALSQRSGKVRVVVIATVQAGAYPAYVEPSQGRRREVWGEQGLFQKHYTHSAIQDVDLSPLSDTELAQFYQYYARKQRKELLHGCSRLAIGLGVGVAASFFDPSGVVLIVTACGTAFTVAINASVQYRAFGKIGHLRAEAQKRGLQLVYDTPSKKWYVAKMAEDIGVQGLLDALANIASAGFIQ